jgi:class 3 adenylate cyclase
VAGGKSHRRVATVMFVDVVESTRVAAEVGDRRWRELVDAFRAAVRLRLKRLDGHEVDTAGDGFFAWFDSPANALSAAAGIAADVQQLGLDVRGGLHTGELEQIDGRLGGIAAHIGARVMAAAGPAELLVTSTVRDLVVGGEVSFEPVGETELKGVPGRWMLHRVTAVGGRAIAKPLAADEAARRRSEPTSKVKRRRPALWAALGAVALAVAVTAVWGLGLAGTNADPSASPSPTAIAQSSATPTQLPTASARPTPPPGIAALRINPFTSAVTVKVPADEHSHAGLNRVLMDSGSFWTSYEGIELVRRNLETGEYEDSIPTTTWSQPAGVDEGLGSLWVGHGDPESVIERIDPLSRRSIPITAPAEVWFWAVGDRAVYLLLASSGDDSIVAEIDPAKNKVGEPYSVGSGFSGELKFQLGLLYSQTGAVLDPTRREIVETGHPFGDIDPNTGTTWVLNRAQSTITPWKRDAGEGIPLGLGGPPHSVAFAFGSVWVAAGSNVYRIDSGGQTVVDTIEMPEGAYAMSIGIDALTNTMWVSSCYGNTATCDNL